MPRIAFSDTDLMFQFCLPYINQLLSCLTLITRCAHMPQSVQLLDQCDHVFKKAQNSMAVSVANLYKKKLQICYLFPCATKFGIIYRRERTT